MEKVGAAVVGAATWQQLKSAFRLGALLLILLEAAEHGLNGQKLN